MYRGEMMCREDGEPEMGCDCDYCVGFGQGAIEGYSGGFSDGMNKANTFYGLVPKETGDFDYEAQVKRLREEWGIS